MDIAVLGTGTVGRTLAGKLAELGHEVLVGTRDPQSTLARTDPDAMGNPPYSVWQGEHPGIRLVPYAEAAAGGDLIVNATGGEGSLDARWARRTFSSRSSAEPRSPPVPLVTVLATGGTIASRTDAGGAATAQDDGADLVARLDLLAGVEVRVRDVFRVGSFRMTLDRVHELARAVAAELADGVDGVVVTHGTDTTEESAFFLDLFHADACPVVVTGAQRAADASDSDGPRNLADAVTVAAAPAARGLGVLIGFGGQLFPARGTRKEHTLAADAFANPAGGPLGWVHDGDVGIVTQPRRPAPLDLDAFDPSGVRVDVVPTYPDADATALRACVDAGARGIVLQATGAGNANPAICAAVEEVTGAGVVVVTSTRVAAGPVAAIYGDGGGIDLLRAGAVPSGLLRPSQARILLAALLGIDHHPAAVREAFRQHVGA